MDERLYKWMNEWMNRFESGIKQSIINGWKDCINKWMNE